MLLATIVLLGALPQSGELARSVANVPVALSVDGNLEAKDSSAARELPSMPKPKVNAEADAYAANGSGSGAASTGAGAPVVAGPSAGAAGRPAPGALAFHPVKPAYTPPRQTPGQRAPRGTLPVAAPAPAALYAHS